MPCNDNNYFLNDINNIYSFSKQDFWYVTAIFILGSYEVNVQTKDHVNKLCTKFELDPTSLKINTSKCCTAEIKGNEFTIRRTNKGPLRLYEVYFEGISTKWNDIAF
jgi:hypothetical protein